MSQRRLALMLVVLGGLAVLRIMVPLSQGPDLVAVAERSAVGGRNNEPTAGGAGDKTIAVASNDWAERTRDLDDGTRGNAFQARVPVFVPPQAQALQPVAKVLPPAAVVMAPAPPAAVRAPDPGPALRVIGSWQDDLGTSVFIVTATGLLQRRTGDALPGGYTLSGISPQFLRVRQLSSGEETSVPVPPGVIAVQPESQ